MDVDTLEAICLEAPGVEGLKLQSGEENEQIEFEICGGLQLSESYTLRIPSNVVSSTGQELSVPQELTFATQAAPCPPIVYRETLGGGGFRHDKSMNVDFRNSESPRTGSFAIKLETTDRRGYLYLCAGTSDHGEGRKPVDLSGCDRLEFRLTGSAEVAWLKIGHPVHDKSFHQIQLDDITDPYQRYSIEVPMTKSTR